MLGKGVRYTGPQLGAEVRIISPLDIESRTKVTDRHWEVHPSSLRFIGLIKYLN
jgi:hypothetical protein